MLPDSIDVGVTGCTNHGGTCGRKNSRCALGHGSVLQRIATCADGTMPWKTRAQAPAAASLALSASEPAPHVRGGLLINQRCRTDGPSKGCHAARLQSTKSVNLAWQPCNVVRSRAAEGVAEGSCNPVEASSKHYCMSVHNGTNRMPLQFEDWAVAQPRLQDHGTRTNPLLGDMIRHKIRLASSERWQSAQTKERLHAHSVQRVQRFERLRHDRAAK